MLTIKSCARCKATVTRPAAAHDYCARCVRSLCTSCMQAGCCGHVPALSGEQYEADGLAPPEATRTVACTYCDGVATQTHTSAGWRTDPHNAPCGRLCGAVASSKQWLRGAPVHLRGACRCALAAAAG